MTGIFRFKFSIEITNSIHEFATIHKLCQRKEYKHKWSVWMETNKDMVDEEIRRIQSLGYKGDIKEKMFVSGRYYFRKYEIKKEKREICDKEIKEFIEKQQPQQQPQPPQHEEEMKNNTRQYIKISKDILSFIDNDINNNTIHEKEIKPCHAYKQFSINHHDYIMNTFNNIKSMYDYNEEEFLEKIKKTYKNRYYINKNKNKNNNNKERHFEM